MKETGSPNAKKRAVVLGGGHAGYRAARQLIDLRRPSDNLEVVMVSTETSEVYHGLMPQIVGGKIEAHHILIPLRHFLPGVVFYNHEVENIDLIRRKVYLEPEEEKPKIEIDYNYLVIALGSVTDLSRFPGLREHGLQTKTIGDVLYLHDHLLAVLEEASVERDPAERKRLLTFVVAGAGYAGIEIGAEANILIRHALRFYPTLSQEDVDFSILASTPRILPSMSTSLADAATRHLEKKGVRIRVNTSIEGANAGEAVLSTGERIPTRTLIVAAGVAPNPVVSSLPLQHDRNRIVTDEYCRALGFPDVYAVGDNAAVPHYKTGGPCPPTALYAFSQGACAGRNIIGELRGTSLRRYRFNSFVDATQLGNTFGLLQFYGRSFSGFLTLLMVRLLYWLVVPSWRCRLGLISDWTLSAIFPTNVSQMKIARSETVVSQRFGPGQEIVRQGDPGSRFYIIHTGKVEVVRQNSDGEEILATLGPGRYFGEIALLENHGRTATVRAAEETIVLSLARRDFKMLVEHLRLLGKPL
jgi:NADH dehydrogenase